VSGLPVLPALDPMPQDGAPRSLARQQHRQRWARPFPGSLAYCLVSVRRKSHYEVIGRKTPMVPSRPTETRRFRTLLAVVGSWMGHEGTATVEHDEPSLFG
jgi:hypothetical protein